MTALRGVPLGTGTQADGSCRGGKDAMVTSASTLWPLASLAHRYPLGRRAASDCQRCHAHSRPAHAGLHVGDSARERRRQVRRHPHLGLAKVGPAKMPVTFAPLALPILSASAPATAAAGMLTIGATDLRYGWERWRGGVLGFPGRARPGGGCHRVRPGADRVGRGADGRRVRGARCDPLPARGVAGGVSARRLCRRDGRHGRSARTRLRCGQRRGGRFHPPGVRAHRAELASDGFGNRVHLGGMVGNDLVPGAWHAVLRTSTGSRIVNDGSFLGQPEN